jgi:N-acetylglucosamine-6-phosphate deacetylase
MAAFGMPPGRYPLGDEDVIVDGQSARRADGRLAGSLLSLDAALRNLVAWTGCAPAAALATVTTTPAALLGLESQYGRLVPGAVADLVLLTPDLHVVQTIIGGQVVYAAV